MQPPKLRIGLVLDSSLDPMDGVQQYVVCLGQWLSRQGHEVHYLVGQTNHRALPNIHSLSRNISVSFNGNSTNIPLPTSRRKLRAFMNGITLDVMHVQTPHHPLMSQRLILAAKPTTAIIGTFHILPYGRLAHFANRALGIWLRPSLKKFDRMLAVSQAAADFEKWSFGLDATVLPNVIDYARFATAQPLPKDDRLQLLFLGRLVERKGCAVLLKAIAQIDRDSVPPFILKICGKGPMAGDLQHFVRLHGLSDIVEFTGFVSEDDKPRYYAAADLAIFPSSGGESFGIVIAEAMSNGRTAVLAADNPGYRSVVADQAQLFPVNDETALAETILRYLSDPALRAQIAAAGQARARQYDVDVVGQQLVEMYQSLSAAKKVQ